ncbi:sensor histidine kinase [Kaistella pullorum]|uniref:histidine kinase n=1 Tax=Kaistella pullorum TaxID=2763074 RepID=A0ABR8WML5_9FLAO|nr:HAMP domain-containing sensor histidine kinase [Kaistella pullorum]MBD8018118.1 HAMP domain-containing histidine kinase [Kaistella pullorum]
MTETKNTRPLIHYSLIVATLIIQVVIAVFIYNEYFNQKKLESIEAQLRDSRTLERAAGQARTDLLQAQDNLRKYSDTQDKKDLDAYFASLRKLSRNLDSIASSPQLKPELAALIQARKKQLDTLPDLDKVIQSVYTESKKPRAERKPLVLKDFKIAPPETRFDLKIEKQVDTVAKKPFLSRLKDAINNESEVQREVVLVTTRQSDTINTNKIKNEVDSVLRNVQEHYRSEIKTYEAGLQSTMKQNDNLYRTYDQLMWISNNWMEVYTFAVGDLSRALQDQFDEQRSENREIRKYLLTGLTILMFLVLMLIIYFTRQSYLYQRELKLANEEINSNLKFKNRILGMLSHEVRAPLKIINLFIDRISKKNSDERIEDYLQSMKYTNSSLLLQATQILEYAKNQQRGQTVNAVAFGLYSETERILTAFRPYIESRNNEFTVQNGIPAETVVFSDHILIYQLFVNILGNANKFTENGKISVRTWLVEQNHSVQMHVKVEDTGSGISKADLKRIFDPYYQGRNFKNVENMGAGLGLNLCRETVELLGGRISAESELAEGTSIYFYINLNKPTQ